MKKWTDKYLIIWIPREYHDVLSKWAAERNLKNPDHKITAETIAEQSVCEYVEKIERMEAGLNPSDKNADFDLEPPDNDPNDFSSLEGILPSQKNAQE